MAVDKLVDSTQLDADLTSVANAIRTKGGTSASLAFPADFITAIAAIPSGGGGGLDCDYGTYTPSSDVLEASVTTTKARKWLLLWAASLPGTADRIAWAVGTTQYGGQKGAYAYANSSLAYTAVNSVTSCSFSSTTAKVKPHTSRKFASGTTYNWIAWGG